MIKMTKAPELLGVSLVVALICATFGTDPTHAASTASSAAEARYQQDRADCVSGKTAQDQKTCLKEAGAALQASREHDLKSGAAIELSANARKRCDPLSGDDRTACLARASGNGTNTGSVAGGGELHEYVTVVPGGETPQN